MIPGMPTSVESNLFSNNLVGVRFPQDAYTGGNAFIKCNTFTGGNHGILKESGSTLGEVSGGIDSGTGGIAPGGNSFIGVGSIPGDPVYDDAGSGLVYYFHLNSNDEIPGRFVGSGAGPNPAQGIVPSISNPSLYCGGNGIGIQSRFGYSYSAILNMMDSLRLNLGSINELKYFQREIMKYHAQHYQLNNLEAYTHTLQGQNQEAYNTLGLYLMDTYRAQGLETKAQALRNALVSNNPQDLEVKNRVKYFDLVGRWHGTQAPHGQLAAQDSSDLIDIASSGTMLSKQACFTLHLKYPNLPGCATTEIANRKSPSGSTVSLKGFNRHSKTAAGALGQNYPNPAQGATEIPYNLPKDCKAATLTINEVVLGREVKSYKLNPRETNLQVELGSLGNGIYTYTLTVDGKPIATRKLSVVK